MKHKLSAFTKQQTATVCYSEGFDQSLDDVLENSATDLLLVASSQHSLKKKEEKKKHFLIPTAALTETASIRDCDLKWASTSPGEQLKEQDQNQSRRSETPEVQLPRTQPCAASARTRLPLLHINATTQPLSLGAAPDLPMAPCGLPVKRGLAVKPCPPLVCSQEGLCASSDPCSESVQGSSGLQKQGC